MRKGLIGSSLAVQTAEVSLWRTVSTERSQSLCLRRSRRASRSSSWSPWTAPASASWCAGRGWPPTTPSRPHSSCAKAPSSSWPPSRRSASVWAATGCCSSERMLGCCDAGAGRRRSRSCQCWWRHGREERAGGFLMYHKRSASCLAAVVDV